MSDVEEPAAKISKLNETEHQDGEEMEEGQEEWLSEEILTDEDYNPVADQEQSNSTVNTSQDEVHNESVEPEPKKPVGLHLTVREGIIEETLNNFENLRNNKKPTEAGSVSNQTEDSTTVKPEENETGSDLDASTKQSDDDGNDTDDLLRMLEDDNSKKKDKSSSKSKQIDDKQHSSDEDDDDYIYEGAKVTKMKVAKNVVMNTEKQVKRLKVAKGALVQKRIATKAVPEDMSDTEDGSEVSKRLGSRFGSPQVERLKMSKGEVQKGGSRTGSEDDKATAQVSTKITKFKSVKALARQLAKKNVSEDNSDADEDSVPKKVKSTAQKLDTSSDEAMTMKRIFGVRPSGAKASPRELRPRNGINAVKTVTKRVVSLDTKKPPTPQPKQPTPAPAPTKVMMLSRPSRSTRDSGSDKVDCQDESQESAEQESEAEDGQALRQPERMDEEVPSDADSHSDADSYYNELPSTDSEDSEEWFTLDLRVERAADYVPLLGANAHSLLVAEQQRAAARLASLRQSAQALCAGRRALASQLRFARQALAQLDAALTAQ